MRFFYKRLQLMISMYINVKDDPYRKKELLKAFSYILKHPYLFFVTYRRIECHHNSVLKNVNTIINRPYVMSLGHESL